MRGRVLASCLVVLAGTVGCTHGLLFVNSHLLSITSPTNYSVQHLPVTLRFTVNSTGHQPAAFAVFLDRQPMPPEQTVRHFAADDRLGITVTTHRTVVYRTMQRRTDAAAGEQDHHEIVVVALDSAGRRSDESFAYVDFTLER